MYKSELLLLKSDDNNKDITIASFEFMTPTIVNESCTEYKCFTSRTMPRTYIRKSTRQSWSEENMKAAVDAVLGGAMGYLKASKAHGVPQTTLESRVKKARSGSSLDDSCKKGRFLNTYLWKENFLFSPDFVRTHKEWL